MTVETEDFSGDPITKSGPYNGNGATATFDYEFQIQDEVELNVVRQNADLTEDTLTLTTDYTVAGVGEDAGGTITLVAPASSLPTGTKLVIQYDGTFNQPVDYSNQGSIQLGELEDVLDRFTMHLRQIKEQVDRSVKVDSFGTVALDTLTSNLSVVASLSTDIEALEAIIPDITAVADIDSDVTTVAGIAANVTTVAGIDSDVTSVASVASDVTAVADYVGDVDDFADLIESFYEEAKVDDVAALLADTGLTYTAGQSTTIEAGDYVKTRKEGFSYTVLDSGASDEHIETAGGVKLHVNLDANGTYPAAALGIDEITDIPLALFSEPITLTGDWDMSSSLTVSNLHLIGRGATITGGDHLGFEVTAGNVILQGDLIAQGFEAATNKDLQATNYTTGFIRIQSGATVSRIRIEPGFQSLDNRSTIAALSTSNDYTIDETINIGEIDIRGATFNGGCIPVNIRCLYSNVKVFGNTFKNIIGASREVCACQFYMDGRDDQTEYQAVGEVWFSGNLVDSVIQRTTTGDSTGGNNYECCGFRAGGQNVQAHGNTFKDITGVNYDCEALYTKAVRFNITNNIFENSGSEEGAINAKGVSPENSASGGSAPGYWGQITGNTIVFDDYSYDHTAEHGSGSTVSLDRTGINASATEGVNIKDNIIIGANNYGIRIQGNGSSANSALAITGNKIMDFTGDVGIYMRGAMEELRVENNDIICKVDNPGSTFRAINYETTESRGTSRNNNRFNNNTLVFHDSTYTGTVALLDIQMDDYSFNTLQANGNIYDVDVNASATENPLWLQTGGDSSELAGRGDRFEMKGWQFSKKITDNAQVGPIRWQNLNAGFVRHYDIDLTMDYVTTDNTSHVVGRFKCNRGGALNVDYEYTASREDVRGVLREVKNMIAYDNSGSLTASSEATIHTNSVGTVTGVTGFISASGSDLLIRANGATGETWNWRIRMKAQSLDSDIA